MSGGGGEHARHRQGEPLRDNKHVGDAVDGAAPRPCSTGPGIAASTAIGVGEAAYAKAVERAFSRVQGGSRLIDHDTIRLELIRHRMNLDIARTYVEAMASSLDDGTASATADMFLYPKIFAGQTALSVATAAVEIHGGLGSGLLT
jgi:alkylation response protein AidB-like acyl-CoA dehydrogenase